MSDNEFTGVCGYELYINTEEEGKVGITLKPEKVVVGDSSRDEHVFMIAARMFRHIFKEHLSPHDLDASNFVIVAEVPEEYLRKEWRTYFEASGKGAGIFKLTTDPVKNEVTKYIPEVVIKDETENEEE